MWYVDNWSVVLDARIIVMTVSQVLRRTSATATEDLGLGFPLAGAEAILAERQVDPGVGEGP